MPRWVLMAAAVALALSGCGDDGPGSPAVDPEQRLREAAAATLEAGTVEAEIRSAGTGSYEVAGLIELPAGRFDVELVESHAAEPGVDLPERVIGTDGEGYETTFAVLPDGSAGLPGSRGPCWFNPHASVGSFAGAMSIEHAVRVSGSVVESIAAGEVDSVSEGSEGSMSVTLAESASRPRDDFKPTPHRIWGARKLLAELSGPVMVGIDEGHLASIELSLEDYDYDYGLPGRAELKPPGSVTLAAAMTPTDAVLEIDEPECQAIE